MQKGCDITVFYNILQYFTIFCNILQYFTIFTIFAYFTIFWQSFYNQYFGTLSAFWECAVTKSARSQNYSHMRWYSECANKSMQKGCDITVFYNILQYFTIFCNILQYFTIFYNILQYFTIFTIFYNFQYFTIVAYLGPISAFWECAVTKVRGHKIIHICADIVNALINRCKKDAI
jgi:hypothetical protein